MAEEVGVAYVSLLPSARGWHRNAQREIDREMRGRSLTVAIVPEVDRSALTAALSGLDGGQRMTVPVDVEISREQVTQAFAAVERTERLTVDVDVPVGEAIRETRQAIAAVEATNPTVNIDVDVDRPGLLSGLWSRLNVDTEGRNLGARLGLGLLSGLGEQTQQGIGGVLSGITQNPIVSTVGLGLAVGLTAAIGPAIFAAIGGAVAGVTLAGAGLGAIFAGAFILSSNPALQEAWGLFTRGVGDTLRGAAEPLVGPLIEGLGIIGDAVRDVGPQLRDMFAAIAPYIPTLAQGVADFIAAFTPGLVDAVSSSGPVIEQIAFALPALGSGLSSFLSAMASVAPQAASFIGMMIRGIGDIITVFGVIMQVGAQLWGGMSVALSVLWDQLRVVADLLSILGAIIMGEFGLAQEWFREFLADMGRRWRGLWGETMPRAASEAIAALIRLLKGLPGQARNAVGSLGSVLWNAGWNLIRGLINGIRAALPNLESTLGWVTSMIPDWKGPADVDRRLLQPTGALIMSGLVSGIQGEVPTLRSELGSITSDIGATGLSAASPAASGGAELYWRDGATGDQVLDALANLIGARWGGDVDRALGGR